MTTMSWVGDLEKEKTDFLAEMGLCPLGGGACASQFWERTQGPAQATWSETQDLGPEHQSWSHQHSWAGPGPMITFWQRQLGLGEELRMV